MQHYPLLDRVNSPADLRALPAEALPELCAEVREFLIEGVSRTGGHLSSNLGVVELTVGIHRVFDTPEDAVFFDVGHQCYVHKLLTGRREGFSTLRMFDGMSGFQRPAESQADPYVSGHASNSVSAALGLARADRLCGRERRAICVIGDGALTGGMLYEALNDAGQSGLPLVIVFNDNEMSIDRNVGALSKRLRRMRVKPRYFKLKARVKGALRRLPLGERMIAAISSFKARLRAAILNESLFELMGLRYLGPADGNDMESVLTLLGEAKRLCEPVVVHLKTVKGRGYLPSEQNPTRFHGIGAFDAVSGPAREGAASYSSVFGDILCEMAQRDERICAVTAAMASGTGLSGFARQFPARFFDVGIAEAHAVTLSAGLASGGMRPVCAIYSTFLQRGYDQLLHDVGIAGLPVVFAVDRAGLVGPDGATHQGAFDVPYLRTVPGMTLLAPASFSELSAAFALALEKKAPVAIRYPRGGEGDYHDNTFPAPEALLREGDSVTLCVYGSLTEQLQKAAALCAESGLSCEIVKLNCLTEESYPLLLSSVQKTGRLLVAEDCAAGGALGERLCAQLSERGLRVQARLCNLGASYLPEGDVPTLLSRCGLDAAGLAEAARELARSHG